MGISEKRNVLGAHLGRTVLELDAPAMCPSSVKVRKSKHLPERSEGWKAAAGKAETTLVFSTCILKRHLK